MPEPGGSSPATRAGRAQGRRAQPTIEVPPAQADPSPIEDGAAHEEQPVGAPAARTAAGRTGTARKSRRASVPSWDEIILGARRD